MSDWFGRTRDAIGSAILGTCALGSLCWLLGLQYPVQCQVMAAGFGVLVYTAVVAWSAPATELEACDASHQGSIDGFVRVKPCCSFCGKDTSEVAKMVAGPTVFICDGCVEICRRALSGEPEDWPKPEPSPFRKLARAAVLHDRDEALTKLVGKPSSVAIELDALGAAAPADAVVDPLDPPPTAIPDEAHEPSPESGEHSTEGGK